WVPGFSSPGSGGGGGRTRQRVDERQDFAMAGRAALVGAAAIGIFDLPISFLARAADDALARRGEPDRDVGHDPFELEENVAPQVDVARVFRSEMNRDDQ